jgi:hypothetical protein
MEPRIAQVKAYLTLVVLFLVLAASKSAAEAIGASFLPLWLSLSLSLSLLAAKDFQNVLFSYVRVPYFPRA